jgi:hypothetical protein
MSYERCSSPAALRLEVGAEPPEASSGTEPALTERIGPDGRGCDSFSGRLLLADTEGMQVEKVWEPVRTFRAGSPRFVATLQVNCCGPLRR